VVDIAGRYTEPSELDFHTSFLDPHFNPNSCLSRKLGRDVMNTIFLKSSDKMDELPDESIHLVVTSPPYNVNKDYERDQAFDDWQKLMRAVFTEVHRVLIPGGRVCIVIANTGRNPYRPLHLYLTQIMLDIGYLMRGEIIWDKGAGVGSSTAWGSWMKATNPCLRDVHEYILIFSKESMRRDLTGASTISREEFLQATLSVWRIPTVSAKKVGHPCPFPLEIPRRLINLYSFQGDTILDPFMGSGQTALAALETGRQYIGYELVPEYTRLAHERLSNVTSRRDALHAMVTQGYASP
jgi:site-specific DNA-methyltransferase (adenine-specific)